MRTAECPHVALLCRQGIRTKQPLEPSGQTGLAGTCAAKASVTLNGDFGQRASICLRTRALGRTARNWRATRRAEPEPHVLLEEGFVLVAPNLEEPATSSSARRPILGAEACLRRPFAELRSIGVEE
eukprot:CAMPEP_0170601346 /NCGR_PEP_ID=MMETSP0224-20130122/17810_1 /TAXON_ID=285029 /ORGANISM="Togula jolla, Strain CCCM 725" /LENGTH=126 /DNA_ID=CAMNT_0010926115 /DNA_START=1005 /DNA_END=1383 /DNA_ORIENTATION=+